MKKKKIKLKNGTLIVPEEFIVVDVAKASESEYAGVIAERHSSIGHYVIFSIKPINQITAEEEDAIYAELGRTYPEIQKVINHEVQAIRDEENKIINLEAWDQSLRLGLFGIPVLGDGEELYCGTGIFREVK